MDCSLTSAYKYLISFGYSPFVSLMNRSKNTTP